MMMSPGYKVVWISPWQDIQHSGGERSFQVLTPLSCTWVKRGHTSVDLKNLHLPTGEVNIIHMKVGPWTWSTCMGSLGEQFESFATLLIKLASSHQEFLTYEDPRLLWWCWFWVKERGPLKNKLRLVYQKSLVQYLEIQMILEQWPCIEFDRQALWNSIEAYLVAWTL